MPDEQSLGELIREFISTLGAYLKQNAADAVNKALSKPLKRAAKKIVFLGFAFGLAVMAAVCLSLGFFNLLIELLEARSAAYAITCVLCLAVAALCAWVVFKDGKKKAGTKPAGDDAGPEPPVDSDSEQAD